MTIPIGISTQLTCTANGLEFDYCNPIAGTPTSYRDITVDIDLTALFATTLAPNAHAVFAFDTSGVNAHSFPVQRHLQRLWRFARGIIFFPDGSIYFERWGVANATVCGASVTRPAVTGSELVRGPGTPYTRLRLRVILALDGSMQYNIDGFNSNWTVATHLAWGQQTAALGKATLPSYTGKFACGFIDSFTAGPGACPEPTVEPTNNASNGKNITVRVVSYTQV